MCICISISITAQFITGALVNPSTTSTITSLSSVRYNIHNRNSVCTDFVRNAINTCNAKNLTPCAICLATKGDVGRETADNDALICSIETDIKKKLEDEFALPTFFVNRFHAFSFGVFSLDSNKISNSLGVVNLSDGVGCGIVKDGKLIQEYNANGTGGLRKISRLSDGKFMPIAQIAGVKALQAASNRERTSEKEVFRRGLSNQHSYAGMILDDIIDATSELICDVATKWNLLHFCVNAYDKCGINACDKKEFIHLLQEKIQYKINKFIFVSLFDSPLTEEKVKLLGASVFAFKQLNSKNMLR